MTEQGVEPTDSPTKNEKSPQTQVIGGRRIYSYPLHLRDSTIIRPERVSNENLKGYRELLMTPEEIAALLEDAYGEPKG
ncbi:MAG: hypothetical protein V2I33_04645 [Kangiellaceae bacterium]|nr:hypothetical protein [Kangiellaceae bacterium]